MNDTTQTRGASVALGNFDGLHRGHLAVLQTAMDAARRQLLRPVVLLFDVHPKLLLSHAAPPLLLTDDMKRAKLRDLGFAVETASFQALRDLSPTAFVQYLKETLQAQVVCCGTNYRFGKSAAGTAADLQRIGKAQGLQVQVAPQLDYDGAPVSATRIREAVEAGDVEAANAMLGRPFSYRLTVVSGDKRGRLLGFPTINQFFPDGFVRARAGVYTAKVFLNGRWHCAVTNIGMRPTIGTESFRSETHILDFSGDLYGQDVEVHLLQYLRPEQKFDTLTQLQTTMQQDARSAKRIWNDHEATKKTDCERRLF